MTSTYNYLPATHRFAKYVIRILACLYMIGLLAAVVYLWTFTQNRYISTATFKISRQDAATSTDPLALAFPGMMDSAASDSQVAIGYIQSADLLMELEKEFDLQRHYSSPSTDFVFRLWSNSPLEERLEYYRKRINAHYNKDTGLTVLMVDTFDPELSYRVAEAVLRKSEEFTNVINQNVANQQVDFMRGEVKRADLEMQKLNAELLEFQNRHKFITPDEVINARLTALHELQAERLKLETGLMTLQRDSPDSPMINVMRSKLATLNEHIDLESAKLSGPERDRLNQLHLQFSELQQRIEFGEKIRTGALASLENTRVTTVSRTKFFTPVQRPYRPEDVGQPRRLYGSATLVVLGLLLFFVIRGIVGSILERP
ncbi:MAG: hypothetical protein V4733_09945 [Verrucomicrobiota bacterium]